MDFVVQILSHTPIWVYAFFAYLVFIGLKARKPGEVAPAKLAIIPVLLTVWGLHDLVRLYGISAGTVGIWLIALALGGLVGWSLLRGKMITADRARGVILRPADYSVLPLVLLIFAVKYTFGVMSNLDPNFMQQPTTRLVDLGLSGLMSGIFTGKFLRYMSVYRSNTKAKAA